MCLLCTDIMCIAAVYTYNFSLHISFDKHVHKLSLCNFINFYRTLCIHYSTLLYTILHYACTTPLHYTDQGPAAVRGGPVSERVAVHPINTIVT